MEIIKRLIKFLYNLFFNRKTVQLEKPTLEFRHEEPKQNIKIGNGRAFKNNRKKTNGRNLQIIKLENGKTKTIYHER